MSSNGYFTNNDLENYRKAKEEIKNYLIYMLNLYSHDKSIGIMMEDRIKTLDSINEKITKKKKIKGAAFNIHLDLQDIAGIRTVFCDKNFLVPSLKDLDKNIHTLTNDMFEYEFRKACEYEDNCNIIDIFNFLSFLEKQNTDNIIIIKDYISNPKNSGYQSLHVLFMASNGCLVEVQFRNYVQHLFNEYEHDIHYKGNNKMNQRYEYIFKTCADFLRNKTNEALDKFFANNKSSKKITLTR